jgi:hypothetical protein
MCGLWLIGMPRRLFTSFDRKLVAVSGFRSPGSVPSGIRNGTEPGITFSCKISPNLGFEVDMFLLRRLIVAWLPK